MPSSVGGGAAENCGRDFLQILSTEGRGVRLWLYLEYYLTDQEAVALARPGRSSDDVQGNLAHQKTLTTLGTPLGP